MLNDRDGNSATNQSVVDYNVYCQSSGSGSISANHDLYFELGGNVIRNENVYVSVKSPNAYIHIASGSMPVTHDNDGNKSIWVGASIRATGGYGVSASIGTTFELNKIPRYANVSISAKSKTLNTLTYNCSVDATIDWKQYKINGGSWIDDGGSNTIRNLTPNTTYSIKVRVRRTDSQLWSESNTISMTTYDIARITSAPDLNIGDSHDITWSNPSGAEISLKLCQTDGTLITDYEKVTGTSKKITPDASAIYKLTPNSNTITLRYIITTAGNYTAYKDCVFTVINSNPTFTNFTYRDINSEILALTGNNQILVKGYSNVEGIVSTSNKATAINSATMKSYKLLIGDKSATVDYSDSKEVKATINAITNNVIDMYAIDSRGNSTKVSKTATIKDYTNIKVTSVKAERENNVGEAVTLSFEGKIWNQSFGKVNNSVTSCIYKYKETSSSEYVTGETQLTYTVKDEKITGSISIKGDLGAKGFDASNSYNIQVIIRDKLTEDVYEVTLGSGTPAIAIYKNKVAIGQKYDESLGGALQIKGEIYQNGKLIDIVQILNEKIIGTVLYEDVNGTNGNVILSDNINNYSHIEITYVKGFADYRIDDIKKIDIKNSNSNSRISLDNSIAHSGVLMVCNSAKYNMLDNTLNKIYEIEVHIDGNGVSSFLGTATRTYITKVIGYKI